MSSMADLTENYQLKWHSFSSHIHSCVASALNKESFTDVSLCTMDGHRILAHRFVLSACSQYLHDILKVQQKITSTLPILIVLPPEISYKTMGTLIQYMYSGETTVSKDILENVLRGGDLLKIKGLWRPKDEKYAERKLVKIQETEKDSPRPELSPLQQPQQQQQQQHTSNVNGTKPDSTPELHNGKDKESNNKCEVTSSLKMKIITKPSDMPQNPENNLDNHKTDSSSTNSSEKSLRLAENATTNIDNLQFLVIKEEPLEWSELDDGEMEMIDDSEMFDSEMTIKPEVVLDDQDQDEKEEDLYTPLTCELCSETFKLPGDWVRHIQTHTDMLPAKRQKRGKSSDEESGTFPPLHCDMCRKYFPTPAEWVFHIQNAHTEFELRVSNKTSPIKPIRISRQLGSHKVCAVCNKKFPSHASMLIHRRTHTGEKPFMCEHCQKGFNVKSNLLRHLRTLHDRIINSTDVEYRENSTNIDN